MRWNEQQPLLIQFQPKVYILNYIPSEMAYILNQHNLTERSKRKIFSHSIVR